MLFECAMLGCCAPPSRPNSDRHDSLSEWLTDAEDDGRGMRPTLFCAESACVFVLLLELELNALLSPGTRDGGRGCK